MVNHSIIDDHPAAIGHMLCAFGHGTRRRGASRQDVQDVEGEQEMSDDLIRRSDVIEVIDDNVNGSDNRLYLKDLIKAIPTIEPKRGKWLPFEYGDDTWHKCSVCGKADKYKGSRERPNGAIAKWEYVRNFCPNCGADMRGADDE